MKRILDLILLAPILKLINIFRLNAPSRGARDLKKILAIKLAAAGDALLLDAVLKGYQKMNPEVEIHWLTSSISLPIAKQSSVPKKIHVIKTLMPWGLFQTASVLRKEKYDAVIDFEQWARGTSLLTWLVGAPLRVGFNTPGQFRAGGFNRTWLKRSEDHELFEFFNLMEILGNVDRSVRPSLSETQRGKMEFSENFSLQKNKLNKGPIVLLHPGCGDDGKPREWPLASYALLCHWLQKKYDATLFLSSGPEEIEKVKNLNKLIGKSGFDFGGKLSWEGTFSLVHEADLIVSGNTGIMHVAAAFGKKQVALHGPTDPDLWGPLNDNAEIVSSPCPFCPCLKLGFEYHDRSQACMKKIEIGQVKTAIVKLFDKPGRI